MSSLLHRLLVAVALLTLTTFTTISTTAATTTTTITGRLKSVDRTKLLNTVFELSNPNKTYTTPLLLPSQAFAFNNVAPGTYTLNTHSIHYVFPTYKVTVDGDSSDDVSIVSATAGSYGDVESHPLTIYPQNEAIYYYERAPVDYTQYLKNPMVIMMLVTLVMVVVMPRMMNSMDPAELEAIKQSQQQYSVSGLMSSLQGNSGAAQSGGTRQARRE